MPNVPPRATVEQERRQRQLSRLVDVSVRRLWRQMRGRTWGTAWRETVGPQIVTVITTGQAAAAQQSSLYIADVLAEFDMPVQAPSTFRPDGFVGVTGDGLDVDTAAYQAVAQAAKAQYGPDTTDLPSTQAAAWALSEGERFIAGLAATVMADTMRAAEQVAMVQRPWVNGYIRVVEPGACSRCIVLAGKFFLFDKGFLRHPRCRCDHAPAPSNPDRLRDLIEAESPERIFDSLSEAEQDRIFTTAGAGAIREGADIGRVVNARRGMSTVGESRTQRRLINGEAFTVNVTRRQQVRTGPRGTFVTTAATTRRGRTRGQTRGPRLMPEAIFEMAGGDRAEALRLLRVHGYIT